MKIKNELNLVFGSNTQNPVVRDMLTSIIPGFISQLNFNTEEIKDILTCTVDAVYNCIDHAYPGKFVGKIFLTVSFRNKREVKIKVRDNGVGIKNIEQAMEHLYSTKEDPMAGLGFSVMECFMDEVKVKSTPGRGTTVTMIKRKEGK